MVDVDEDALLAQALWAAEQADYYDGSNYDAESRDDSDYAEGSKRKRRQSRPQAGRVKRTKTPHCEFREASIRGESSSTILQQQLTGQPLTDTNNAVVNGLPPAPADGKAQQLDLQCPPILSASGKAHSTVGQQSETGRRKRRDTGQKREKGRSWNEQEEAAFLTGLETHGRDWKAIGEAIGSRDSRQVASHAQKHFIKLCLAGEPLPAKVAESGVGYTLSGKLLDPNSSAAIAYGFSLDVIKRLEGDKLATALGGIMQENPTAGDASAQPSKDQVTRAPPRKRRRNSSPVEQDQPQQQSQLQGRQQTADSRTAADAELASVMAVPPPVLAASEAVDADQPKRRLAGSAATAAANTEDVSLGASNLQPGVVQVVPSDHMATSAAAQPDGYNKQLTPDVSSSPLAADGSPSNPSDANPASAVNKAATATADGITDYARSRPRREGAGGRMRLQLGSTSESLDLVCCRDFYGPPGSGMPGSQPFSVEVDMEAMLLMEVHSHLSSCEIIGLLGGMWDVNSRSLKIMAAYPCRRAAGSDAATSVELDPSAEVEARGAMSAAGQRCVGWYHSHPVFEPRPSLKDMENQRNYQALTRDSQQQGAMEPFVGFIMGPYDLQLPRPHSAITAFVVQQKGQDLVPYNIRYGMINARQLQPKDGLRDKICSLLLSTKHDLARTAFAAQWRCFTAISPKGALLGPPISKVDKLLTALQWQCSHVEDRESVNNWLQTLCQDVAELWEVPAVTSSNSKLALQQQQHGKQDQGSQQQCQSASQGTLQQPKQQQQCVTQEQPR